MKRNLGIIVTGIFLFSLVVSAGEKAPQKVIDLANNQLVDIAKNPIIIKAVEAENAKKKGLPKIQELDEKWKATPGIDPFMKSLMESECAKQLTAILNEHAYFAEIFVMDNLGANVAMSDKTSDYWQGDEAKFQKSYNKGKGAVFIDEVEFDDSAQLYLVQVSVPVKNGDKVIGAITFGIDIDKLDDK